MDERARRIAKVEALRASGTDPYPVRFDRTHTAAEVHEHWGTIESGSETEDEVQRTISGCNAVIAGAEPYTAAVLEATPGLRVIARTGVGFDAVVSAGGVGLAGGFRSATDTRLSEN